MSWFCVDVESDGPIPNKYSMVCFGAVHVPSVSEIFYGQTKPISELWIPEALAVSGFTREEHLQFHDPETIMRQFADWIEAINFGNRPTFVSDNLAYDWQFINYYFHYYLGKNPFGYSGRRIGDIYSGIMKDINRANEWEKFRRTKHSHNPADDAMGNAEALRYILNHM